MCSFEAGFVNEGSLLRLLFVVTIVVCNVFFFCKDEAVLVHCVTFKTEEGTIVPIFLLE